MFMSFSVCFCLYVYAHGCMFTGTHRDQKTTSDTPKLELQAVVSCPTRVLRATLDPLGEQQALLTGESTFQPPIPVLNIPQYFE